MDQAGNQAEPDHLVQGLHMGRQMDQQSNIGNLNNRVSVVDLLTNNLVGVVVDSMVQHNNLDSQVK